MKQARLLGGMAYAIVVVAARAAMYGVDREQLGGGGPKGSVVHRWNIVRGVRGADSDTSFDGLTAVSPEDLFLEGGPFAGERDEAVDYQHRHRAVEGEMVLDGRAHHTERLLNRRHISSKSSRSRSSKSKSSKSKVEESKTSKTSKYSSKSSRSRSSKSKSSNNSQKLKSERGRRTCLERSYPTCLERTGEEFTSETIVHDNQKPYTAPDEEIVSGTMYLSLLQDNTTVNCDNALDMEELVLSYLADNIGGDDTDFEPACVQVEDSAYDRQVVPVASSSDGSGAGDFVESTVLKLKLSYVQKEGSDDGESESTNVQEGEAGEDSESDASHSEGGDGEERALQAGCTTLERAQCCSQNAIDSNPSAFCASLGCDLQRCGAGRRPRRSRARRGLLSAWYPQGGNEDRIARVRRGTVSSSSAGAGRRLHEVVPPFVLKGEEFTPAVRQYTEFQPEESQAHLGVEDTEAVAVCSASRYSIEKYGTPTLECDEYTAEDCNENDDLLPPLDDKDGACLIDGVVIRPPTGAPIPVPMASPTSVPTALPTNKCFQDQEELIAAIEGYIAQECGSNSGCEVAKTYGWPMNSWCVSLVMDMSALFAERPTFNEDISDWDTSSVTDISYMFAFAYSFNGDLSRWDTSSVTDMANTFYVAFLFNGDLSSWDTSSVDDMSYMFASDLESEEGTFNGDLSNWDTSSVTTMESMFQASSFNRDLSSWNTSSVANMAKMFDGASSFNGGLSNWDTSSTTDMASMFNRASTFNGDLLDWDTSSVTTMSSMFTSASLFNGDLSSWDTASVTSMAFMFLRASSFDGDLSSWDTSSVTDMWAMFYEASLFNGDLSSWDISAVNDMETMFFGASSFNQNLCGWSDDFTYNSSNNIFEGSGCTFQETANLEIMGPFCASMCMIPQ